MTEVLFDKKFLSKVLERKVKYFLKEFEVKVTEKPGKKHRINSKSQIIAKHFTEHQYISKRELKRKQAEIKRRQRKRKKIF